MRIDARPRFPGETDDLARATQSNHSEAYSE